jgi:hypothetical protein
LGRINIELEPKTSSRAEAEQVLLSYGSQTHSCGPQITMQRSGSPETFKSRRFAGRNDFLAARKQRFKSSILAVYLGKESIIITSAIPVRILDIFLRGLRRENMVHDKKNMEKKKSNLGVHFNGFYLFLILFCRFDLNMYFLLVLGMRD